MSAHSYDRILNDTLNEYLNLPVIGGNLVAFFQFEYKDAENDFVDKYPESRDKTYGRGFDYKWRDKFKQFLADNVTKYHIADWRLEFLFSGPDARYNSGFKEISSEHFDKLVEDLSECLMKMNALSKASFTGSYSKNIGTLFSSNLEVVADSNRIGLKFWVSSGTYSSYRFLNIEELNNVIEQLRLVPRKAFELMINLETISF